MKLHRSLILVAFFSASFLLMDSDSLGKELSIEEVEVSDLAKAIETLPKEKRADFIKRWEKLQREKWNTRLKEDYESGKVPKDGHKVLGTWRDERKRRKYVFKADGTFEAVWFQRTGSGTWRISPGGSVILRLPKGGLTMAAITEKGMMLITYGMDYTPPVYQKDKGKNRSEQAGARQPATAPDSKSEGREKTKPESEARSQ